MYFAGGIPEGYKELQETSSNGHSCVKGTQFYQKNIPSGTRLKPRLPKEDLSLEQFQVSFA